MMGRNIFLLAGLAVSSVVAFKPKSPITKQNVLSDSIASNSLPSTFIVNTRVEDTIPADQAIVHIEFDTTGPFTQLSLLTNLQSRYDTIISSLSIFDTTQVTLTTDPLRTTPWVDNYSYNYKRPSFALSVDSSDDTSSATAAQLSISGGIHAHFTDLTAYTAFVSNYTATTTSSTWTNANTEDVVPDVSDWTEWILSDAGEATLRSTLRKKAVADVRVAGREYAEIFLGEGVDASGLRMVWFEESDGGRAWEDWSRSKLRRDGSLEAGEMGRMRMEIGVKASFEMI